jgi:hypothetical protein
MLAAVGGLARKMAWLLEPLPFDNQTIPPTLEAYYNSCIITYFKAFVPLVAAAQSSKERDSANTSNLIIYKGCALVYASPSHHFQVGSQWYAAQLLQHASRKN